MAGLVASGSTSLTATHPDSLYLGMMEPDADDIGDMVAMIRQAVEAKAHGLADDAALPLFAQFWPISYRRYLTSLDQFRALQRELQKDGRLSSIEDTAPMRGFLALRWRAEFTPDLQGYMAYLKARNPALERRIDSLARPSALPEEGRQEHTLIVAPSK